MTLTRGTFLASFAVSALAACSATSPSGAKGDGTGGSAFPDGTGGGFVIPPGTGGEFGTGGGFREPDFGTGGQFLSPSSPILDSVVTAPTAPPPISGGTLLALADGETAMAADPDRDQVYVVDLGAATLTATVRLNAGDEPGRLVQDKTGAVHVVLRGAGAIATIDPRAGKVTLRRPACATPRGIAYDPAKDRLYVACASGELQTFTPTGTTPLSTWMLAQDLRDVVVDGDTLLVTRFRSAEVLTVDPTTGAITDTVRPPAFSHPAVHQGMSYEPGVAWRAVAAPDGGLVMVHQRGMYGRVQTTPGGYGGLAPCDSIVHTAVCRMKRGAKIEAGPALPSFVLPVDVAVSPDGKQVAMVAAGNGHAQHGGARRLFTADLADVTSEWSQGCGTDDRHGPSPGPTCTFGGSGGSLGNDVIGTGGGPFSDGSGGAVGAVRGNGGTGGAFEGSGGAAGPLGAGSSSAGSPEFTGAGGVTGIPPAGERCSAELFDAGEPVAVAYAPGDRLLVQLREPAVLAVVSGAQAGLPQEATIALSSESRADTGHTLFHANSGGGLACASCHPEGHDDGRVWDFDSEGSRRTQDPSGGLLKTAPFHWNGDIPDFSTLVKTVFVGRMSGPALSVTQALAMQKWVEALPELPPLRATSDPAVVRGKALFESPATACTSCHGGDQLTNNNSVAVGTGQMFQVPSLRGVGWRAPYMHDGCAATLSDRFTDAACGGGDQHGMTSQLSDADRADLIAYLQSL